MNKIGNRSDKKEVVDIPEETEEIHIETETAEAQTEAPEPIVFSDYLGYWHPSNNTGNIELRILSADSQFIEFTLWYSGQGEIKNVKATIDKNTASFEKTDSGNLISGTLIFEEALIKLSINNSNADFIKAETITFDGRHTDPYQSQTETTESTEKETESSLPSYNKCVDPTTRVAPFFQYVNTPNDILHLRTGPDITYVSIAKMADLSTVEVCGYNANKSWAYVYSYDYDLFGWCNSYFLITSLTERY